MTLLGKAVHPCTTTLGGTTIVITIEECLLLAVLVENLEDLHIGIICWYIGALLESKAIYSVGCVEHAIFQRCQR